MPIFQRTTSFFKGSTVKKNPGPRRTTSTDSQASSTRSDSSHVPTATSISSCSVGQILDQSALAAPCDYIRSLPSKDIRKKLIDAFNIWFQLPNDDINGIGQIINDLHNASLILDDIQDDSLLRRGSPATHCIFGNAQSINSATYMFMNTCLMLQHVPSSSPATMDILLKGMMELFVGQSWELKWKYHVSCPSVPEYMAMIDGKTGAMFNLLVRLMHNMSQQDTSLLKYVRFATLLGRFYQVRDDYLNLLDDKYSEQKGFCEDLDEGKFSYPIVSCCNSDPGKQDVILGIFRQNGEGRSPLSKNTKIYILDLIKRSGAFEATCELLSQLKREVWEALSDLEVATGQQNVGLRHIMKALSVV